MVKDLAKKRKKDLGIFYTPPEVVDFIFNILNIWKNKDAKENKRWQFKKPKQHYPSVIDPACGEGIFLKKAVDGGFTTPSYIWGVDLDEKVKEEWKKITLLKSFGSKANLDFHFYHQDGLLPIPEKKVGHKKGGMNQYDAVVGNPPYGGVGINEVTPELEKALFDFEIWKWAKNKGEKQISDQLGLLGTAIEKKDKSRLLKFPIEILFLDRFIQLAKPGGWIAIIIPDGILTNSNSHYVREFISHKTQVEAIVSLPRNTFKEVGTSAKTSILFLRKLKKDEKPIESHPVFLASLEKIDKKYLDEIVNSYEKFYNSSKARITSSAYNSGENHMNTSNTVQITKDQNGREVVLVRVDKNLRELMEEKPSSRFNPSYWHPIYEQNIARIKSSKLDIQRLGNFILKGIEGLTYGQVGLRSFSSSGNVQYLQVINITPTGIDTQVRDDKVEENSRNDPKRSRLKVNDLLLVNQGVGSLGKTIVFLLDGKFNVSQHIDVIRLKNISPYYVCVFLQTNLGRLQIERFNSGVSGQINITFDQIKSIIIPIISDRVQKNIENIYREIFSYHYKAMEAKKKGNEGGYRENLETAVKMLKDLIKRTEEVIEGKREDVN